MRPKSEKITCIITLHNEGVLAHKTIRSVLQAATRCAGVPCEVLLVMDNPDVATAEYVQRSNFRKPVNIETVSLGDPAKARNFAIDRASGDFIAIVDGDDLISENWLSEAYTLVSGDKKLIVHPEWNISFGAEFLVWRHPDQRHNAFDPSRLLVENFWSALCFAHRSTFEKVPYLATRSKDGFGYEDWHWNCTTISSGFIHTIALNTAHFIRIGRRGSRNIVARDSKNSVPHSPLFDDRSFWLGE